MRGLSARRVRINMARRLHTWVVAAIVLLIFATVGGYYTYRTQYLPGELRVAATNGDLPRVQKLLQAGIDVNQPLGLPSNSVLNRAIESGNPAVVEAILNAGADPNATGETGRTPLIVAAFFGNAKVVELLLQHGARTEITEEQHRNTALLTAIRKGHSEVVRALIKGGANPNQGKERGDIPLCRAQSAGQSDIVVILQQAGAACP